MGMLDGLVGQLAANAIGRQMGVNPGAMGGAGGLGGLLGGGGGGLGGLLGSVLGGGQQPNRGGLGMNPGNMNMGNAAGGLGGMLGGGSQGGGLGGILGSVLGGGQPPAYQPQTPGFSLGGGNSKLLFVLMPLVLMWIQRQGGIGNLMSSLTGHGLGSQAQSWIGTGTNAPLGGQEVSQLFGEDQINQFAQQSGASPDEVRQSLGTLMPEVVNQLTPHGDTRNAPDADNEIGDLLGNMRRMLG